MLVVTTPNIEGKKVARYLGIVTGEAIMGANLFKDLFASITDVIGGRAAAYERELTKAKEIAVKEMEGRAAELGANAILAVDLDYEVLGDKGSMLMVSASGTAVVVQ
ncbi:hypothetical protein AMJ39_06715 [candidate division TA06 bacterium DG_24]|uniref:UPF0145 protein AMJ82_03205 n=2 Tax=Bacteria division TA06 TaxID=1156500 RepID=A0A0S8GBR3_UNCT6|nr:MAG: hypothetical protein AMJ39_06715 [candidate division TA06 bacterium DG_24]KPK70486.1 MAG: hypothetical protein AMJ82_03205 [candidate division TA06 bacterium SM23_40]